MFEHKCVFKIKSDKDPIDLEELELELIDYGADEVFEEEDEDGNKTVVIYGAYKSFGEIQKYIEEKGYTIVSGGFERIPTVDLKKLPEEQRIENEKLIERIENDEDVQNVYHTLDLSDSQ